MIPLREVREKARGMGVPISTIERDYAQNWLLKYLTSINIALKGGTGIRKVYIENYRFSDDLDFTLLENVKGETIRDKVQSAVLTSREESGIDFSEVISFYENENGFEIDVYFQISQRGPSRTRIKIDLTKHTNEKILLPLNTMPVIHPYSDDFFAQVKVYSLEEIMSEKIRSLFQRTRPRDLYDVWFLWEKVDMAEVKGILPGKFSIKEVKLDIDYVMSRRDDFGNAWITSLEHQLGNLPNFEKVFEKVLRRIRNDFQ